MQKGLLPCFGITSSSAQLKSIIVGVRILDIKNMDNISLFYDCPMCLSTFDFDDNLIIFPKLSD